jgi:hypothetical protein
MITLLNVKLDIAEMFVLFVTGKPQIRRNITPVRRVLRMMMRGQHLSD